GWLLVRRVAGPAAAPARQLPPGSVLAHPTKTRRQELRVARAAETAARETEVALKSHAQRRQWRAQACARAQATSRREISGSAVGGLRRAADGAGEVRARPCRNW